MDITPVIRRSIPVIAGYGAGAFTLAGERRQGSILIVGEEVFPLQAASINDLSPQALSPLLSAGGIELLLIGTGQTMRPVPPALKACLREAGIACEGMDTGAACRTYNVLIAV